MWHEIIAGCRLMGAAAAARRDKALEMPLLRAFVCAQCAFAINSFVFRTVERATRPATATEERQRARDGSPSSLALRSQKKVSSVVVMRAPPPPPTSARETETSVGNGKTQNRRPPIDLWPEGSKQLSDDKFSILERFSFAGSYSIRYFMQSLIELQVHFMIYILIGGDSGDALAARPVRVLSFLCRKERTSRSLMRATLFEACKLILMWTGSSGRAVERSEWYQRHCFGTGRLTEDRPRCTYKNGLNWTCRRSMEQFRVDLDTVWWLIKSLMRIRCIASHLLRHSSRRPPL